MPVKSTQTKRFAAVRMLLVAGVSIGAIALLPGLSSAAVGSHSTKPSLARTAPGRIAGPASVNLNNNRNVSKKAGYQGETTVAIDPTDATHMLASANDLTGSNAAQVYETHDSGRHWVNANVGLTTLCYDPWLDFNAAGDAFFSYECSNESYAYRIHATTRG